MKKLFLSILLSFILIASAQANSFFLQGKKSFYEKDYKKANTYFVKALFDDPNDAECRYYYAQTLTYLKKYEQAKVEYGYVIQLAPSTVLAKYAQTSLDYLDGTVKSNNISSKIQINNDNYIKKAITSDGELVTWNTTKMPLKVYFDNKYNVSDMYLNAAKKALMTWENASEGLVKFLQINSSNYADIIITFEGMAMKTENQVLGFTKHSSSDSQINKVEITLYTLGPNYKKLTPTDVYNVALHEYGHMLGIWGHSDDKNDIMYALYDTNAMSSEMSLSARDKNTISTLYKIDKNPYSRENNSITSILGNKTTRVNEKLKQELEYVENIPSNPMGYVNVGNSYLALDKEYEAIEYYKEALKLDSNNKEASAALASIYTKRNDLNNAEIYYKNLMRIEPKNVNVYLNLANLYIKNKKFSKAQQTMKMLFYRNSDAKKDDRTQYIMQEIDKK